MSSSSAANNVLSAGILPTTNTLIPAGIALAVFAPVACLLNIPPLIFHFRNRNTAAVSLVAWVLFHNLLSLINLLIWPTDDFKDRYNGEGLCDVEIKFIVARAVALPAATLCIVRSLANVMNTNKSISIPTAAQRRRAMVMDLVWCVGLPIIMMFLHYIVQPNRYFLAGVSGCTPSFWSGWVSILLTCLPPLLLSLANAFYAGLVLYRVRKYNSAFKSIVASSNTTRSRFYRLLAISLILTLGLIPVEIYVLVSNLPRSDPRGGFRWSVVHNPHTWQYIVLYHSAVFYDRWVNVALGFIIFLLFGLGRDAKRLYSDWLLALGFGRLFPTLRVDSRGNTTSDASHTSATGKVKQFIKSKLSSSSSKGSTLEADDKFLPVSPFNSAFPVTKPDQVRKGFNPFTKHQNTETSSLPRDTTSTRTPGRSKLFSFLQRGDHQPVTDSSKNDTFAMAELGGARGTIKSGAWSEHGSQEILTQQGLMPDKEVMVRKEVHRASESV